MKQIIYTIGHSDLDPNVFVRILKNFKIEVLIDVRSQPYSSYVKHFNKGTLKELLKKHKIDYYYGGNFLGGRPDDESLCIEGKVDFELLRKTSNYKKGLQLLSKFVSLNKIVVIMCSEEDPRKCHRNKLIAQDLIKVGFEVRHIRADSSYEVAEIEPVQMELSPVEDIKDKEKPQSSSSTS